MAKQMSTQAQAAKAIRAELKSAFPEVKFTVKSTSFAGGDAVHIDWFDGPVWRQVEKITGKYEYGTFDGMTDSYNYDNRREDIPQVKYVQHRRDQSNAATLAVIGKIEAMFRVKVETTTNPSGNVSPSYSQKIDGANAADMIWRMGAHTTYHCDCGAVAELSDTYCGGCGEPLENRYR